jgi:hypothetical protein
MRNILRLDLGEFTLGWFLLSVLVGGILGAAIKYLFEVQLPESLKQRRLIRQRVRKYSYPLLQAASDLELRIDNMLTNGLKGDWLASDIMRELEEGKGFLKDPDKRGYFLLSSLYVFARYFAWVEILRREARFVEFPLGNEANGLFGILHRVNNSFRCTSLWPDISDPRSLNDSIGLYRHVQSAIGETMVVERNKELECISFREFANKYRSSGNDDFRFWLRNLVSYFEGLSSIQIENIELILEERREYRVLRLIAIQYWLFELVCFLDSGFDKVQPRHKEHKQNLLNLLPERYRASVINLPAH